MENSAEKAIEIGVNVFIFIIALSCALILMTNVLNMSELASIIIKDTTSSTLMELYGETDDRVYSGQETLNLISEYNSDTNKINESIILKIKKDTGVIQEINNEYKFSKSELDGSYHIIYNGIEVSAEDNIERKVYLLTKIQITSE